MRNNETLNIAKAISDKFNEWNGNYQGFLRHMRKCGAFDLRFESCTGKEFYAFNMVINGQVATIYTWPGGPRDRKEVETPWFCKM